MKEGFELNNQPQKKEDQDIDPPISFEDYKKTLGTLTREEIIERLIKSGQSKEDAEEFADEVDEDR